MKVIEPVSTYFENWSAKRQKKDEERKEMGARVGKMAHEIKTLNVEFQSLRKLYPTRAERLKKQFLSAASMFLLGAMMNDVLRDQAEGKLNDASEDYKPENVLDGLTHGLATALRYASEGLEWYSDHIDPEGKEEETRPDEAPAL